MQEVQAFVHADYIQRLTDGKRASLTRKRVYGWKISTVNNCTHTCNYSLYVVRSTQTIYSDSQTEKYIKKNNSSIICLNDTPNLAGVLKATHSTVHCPLSQLQRTCFLRKPALLRHWVRSYNYNSSFSTLKLLGLLVPNPRPSEFIASTLTTFPYSTSHLW
jgi:hypothetical protein